MKLFIKKTTARAIHVLLYLAKMFLKFESFKTLKKHRMMMNDKFLKNISKMIFAASDRNKSKPRLTIFKIVP